MIRCITVLLVAALFPTIAAAQSTSYTTYLLPLTPAVVEGQSGATWEVQLTLSNSSDSPISLFCFTTDCQPIASRSVQRVEAPPRNTIVPGLMYVPTDQSRRLFAALRSRNTTLNSEERNFVSEIPVVHENDFRSSILEITAVPIEANYRHMLRAYDANANEEVSVRVRIYGMMNGQIVTDALVDTNVVLRTTRGSASPHARPDEPSWGALADFGDLGDVRNYPEVHIRIENYTDDTELWAFATATNNTTQRFAVYTP